MIYGYARVSTNGQAKDGNSLEAQEKLLRENGAEKIFSDSFTGTKTNRPELNKLLNIIQNGDTLIVSKLDRIARSTIQGAELIQKLLDKNIKINILNIGIMDNTPSLKLIRNIFFAFAEFERDMIVERTQEGKAIAKQKADFREGRPRKYKREQYDLAMTLLEKNSINQVSAMVGIPRATLCREIKRRKDKLVV